MHLQYLDFTYPSDPCSALGSECNMPCGLERLEVFIWLEERLDAQDIGDAEREEDAEDDSPLGVSLRQRHFCWRRLLLDFGWSVYHNHFIR